MSEAKFKIGVDGGQRSADELRKVKEEFKSISGVADKTESTLKGVAEGIGRMGMDFVRAANDMKAINFGAAADKFKGLDDSLTRMAVRAGKSTAELRKTFGEMGAATGTGTARFAENVKQFDRMTFSGLDDAATAMKSLGTAAEDADMSIEEMQGLGQALYQKLGVPAKAIGDELQRIKALAADASIPGGLGAMAGILTRLTQHGGNRVAGGTERMGAMVASLRAQGMSPEMAEEQAGKMIQMVNSFPQHLVAASLKKVYGKNYNPLVRDPRTGRVQYRDDAYEGLQKVFKRAPNEMGALLAHTGMGVEGVEAAQTFAGMDWKQVNRIQHLPETIRKGGGIPIGDFAKEGGSAQLAAKRALDRALGRSSSADEPSDFSQTAAGQRVRTDNEKAAVEQGVGARVQRARDRHDAMYKGHRGEQAAVATVTSYLPESLQNAVQLGSAAAASNVGTQGGDHASAALTKAAGAMEAVNKTLQTMPQATADAVKGINRSAPLGAAREEAKHN